MKKRIAVLTGGGDAPGLNAAIKAIVYRSFDSDYETIGIIDGWEGLLDTYSDEYFLLTKERVRTWDRDGGTNIGSSRTNPFRYKGVDGNFEDRSKEVLKNVERLGIEAVIAIGGEDTLGVAKRLGDLGLPVVGIPKTIDKDLLGTDYTIGFDTAVRNCSDFIEKARTPAGSHHWIHIIEVMGRNTGHLAFWSGLAGGAYIILIPEFKFSYEHLVELLDMRLSKGTRDRVYPRYAVVVVAEGAESESEGKIYADDKEDSFGHKKLGGIGQHISDYIMKVWKKYESRATILGYPQRGGAPSPVDKNMALLFGTAAVDLIVKKRFGYMVSARGIIPGCEIGYVHLSEVTKGLNYFDCERYYDKYRYNVLRRVL